MRTLVERLEWAAFIESLRSVLPDNKARIIRHTTQWRKGRCGAFSRRRSVGGWVALLPLILGQRVSARSILSVPVSRGAASSTICRVCVCGVCSPSMTHLRSIILAPRAPHCTSPSRPRWSKTLQFIEPRQFEGEGMVPHLVGTRFVGPAVDRFVDRGHGRALRLGDGARMRWRMILSSSSILIR
jgi:hypothetical protein